jgi:DNA-directed RNA polymerase subunit beta
MTVKELEAELVEKLADRFLGEKLPLDVVVASTGEVIIPCNRKITKSLLRRVAINRDNIDIDPSPIRRIMLEILSIFEPRFEALKVQPAQ